MKVPLLDISKQHESIRSQLVESLTQVLDSGQYILGKKVEELEAKVAVFSDCKYDRYV